MDRREFIKTSAAVGVASAGQTSAPAATTTPAYLGPHLPDLKPAAWIWYPSGRTLANTFVLFRRELTLAGPPKRARGWILADSRYQLDINGQRVQWGPAPGDPRWPEADPLDLTSLLKAGLNVIGSTVLYYGHGDGTWPIGKAGFLFWLEIEEHDGRKITIVSDQGWQAMLCRAWKPGQYRRWFLRALQEDFDARLYPYGWTNPEYRTGRDWLPAMPLGGQSNQPSLMTTPTEYATGIRTGPPDCELRPRSVPMLDEPLIPVKAMAESLWIEWVRPPEEYFESRTPDAFQPVRSAAAVEVGPGSWRTELDGQRAAALTFEFAEQIVGWPYFTVQAPAGTIIELMSQEGHEIGGPALLNTHFDNWTRFTCREGVNEFECFDFESLRWLQLHVRNCRGSVTVSQVGVRRRLYPWPNKPSIRTSDPALQRLFDASLNTLHNCAQDTLVDGMGRERQQYSGDCGHQLRAVRLAFGETRSPERFLRTYSHGQTPEGYFLDCWPAYDRLARVWERELGLFHLGPILDHGVQLNIDVWQHYLFTGQLDIVQELHPKLVRFAQYLTGLIDRDGDGLLPVENLGIPCVWMDYAAYPPASTIAGANIQRHRQCAFNLYTAAMLEHALAPICRVCGDEKQADAFVRTSRRLVTATVQRFWSKDRRLFINNLPWLAQEKRISMCDRSLATAVIFDQCPGGDITASLSTLADAPKEMGFSYTCNAGWRLWALAKGGRPDAILHDLRTRWATMDSVRLNNTLQEQWKVRPDSTSQWSHCPLAPLYILYEGLVGLRALAPGFQKVELRPQLADLPDLDLTAHAVPGPLRFAASGQLGDRRLTIELPSGCTGEIVLPQAEKPSLEPATGPTPQGCRRYRLPVHSKTDLHLVHT
jgi:alpha-L-rhamnosidase